MSEANVSEPATQPEPLIQRPEGVTEGDAEAPQTVPVNVYETQGALVVVAPLPGVTADDVKVTVATGEVRITAAMRSAAPKNYLVHEWHYGPYERAVAIPSGFGSNGSASFGNGQLAVRLERGDATDQAVELPVS